MRNKLSILILGICLMASFGSAKERAGQVTINIKPQVDNNAKSVALWLPYPVSNENQTITNIKIKDTANNSAVYCDPKSGSLYLYAEWLNPSKAVELEMSFDVVAKEITAKDLVDKNLPVPIEIKKYLKTNYNQKTNQKIAKILSKITKNKKGILAKSKAVYDWVVENTCRDPKVVGCGLGQAEITLDTLGGKCADITSVYIALARSAGVPAREVFGLRLGKKQKQDMSKGYHCWAEFYLPGTGWVQVDPADVRKLMLVKNLDLKQAEKYRQYYFGSVDQYRMALAKDTIDVKFCPPQKEAKPHYFMYPYAEVDGKSLDYLSPRSFAYAIKFEEK